MTASEAGTSLQPTADTTNRAASRSALRMSASVFLQNKLAIIGLAITVFMVLFSFVGPLIYHTDLAARLSRRAASAALRARARLQHLEYMIANVDKLVFGGLLSVAPGEPNPGTIFVLELPTLSCRRWRPPKTFSPASPTTEQECTTAWRSASSGRCGLRLIPEP